MKKEKKIIRLIRVEFFFFYLKFGPQGGVRQIAMQFTPVSKKYIEPRTGKTVLKIWSLIAQKMT